MVDVIKSYNDYNPPEADSPWLKFSQGTTTIRILSHSITWRSHYIRKENKSYKCSGDVSTCQWCQEGEKPRSRWAYLILNRDVPEVKIVEIGWQVFETILELAKDKDYGDPRAYDIKIIRKGQGRDTDYKVIPGKKSAFTEQERLLLRSKDLANIDNATKELLSYYQDDSKEKSSEKAKEIVQEVDEK